MFSLRSLLVPSLVFALGCGDQSEGDDLPPGAFTSGPETTAVGSGDSTSSVDPTATDTSDGGDTTTTGPADSSTTEPIQYSHDEHILPLWVEHCSSNTACHDADAPAVNLDLASDGVYTRICESFHGFSGMSYIDCSGGDPQNSYIFRKLESTHDDGSISGASGTVMPPGGMLDATTLGIIEAWISQGAMP